MSDKIHELLNRNLQEVFGEGDAARRRAAIEELYTDDCVLYVPPGVLVGHDALDKFAGDLRATHPHFVYTPHGEPQPFPTLPTRPSNLSRIHAARHGMSRMMSRMYSKKTSVKPYLSRCHG